MRVLDEKYIDCIEIPDIDNGLSKKNAEYFDFPDSQYQLLGKRSYITLCVMVIAFIAYVKINKTDNTALALITAVILAMIAFWYQFESRYMRYYKKARKAAKSGALQYSLKFINKIVASGNIYYTDMPVVYLLLKAKELLKRNEIIAAELVIEKLIFEHPKCFEAWYIKGLCAYMSNEDNIAYEKLIYVSRQQSVSQQIKNSALQLSKTIAPDKTAVN